MSESSTLNEDSFLGVINDFSKEIGRKETLFDLLKCITESVRKILNIEDCVIYMADNETRTLHQFDALGPKKNIDGSIFDPIVLRFAQGIVGSAASEKKTQFVNDTTKDPRYVVDDKSRLSELAVPIILGDNVVGVIDSEHSEKNFYTENHKYVFETIAQIIPARINDLLSKEKLNRSIQDLKAEITKTQIALRLGEIIAVDFEKKDDEFEPLIGSSSNTFFDGFKFDNLNQLIDTEYKNQFENKIQKCISGSIDHFSCETSLRAPAELSQKWNLIDFNVLRRSNCKRPLHIIMLIRDITAKKHSEILAIEIEEKERLSISKEIHDNIATTLSAARFLNTQILNSSSNGIKESIKEVDQLLNKTIKASRLLVNKLSTSLLNRTLFEVIQEIIFTGRSIFDGQIELEWEGLKELSDIKMSLNLIRILQIGIENSIIHSEAELIGVKVRNLEEITLILEDDGKGFDSEQVLNPAERYHLISNGIHEMQKIALSIGAQLEIISNENSGTRIICKT